MNINPDPMEGTAEEQRIKSGDVLFDKDGNVDPSLDAPPAPNPEWTAADEKRSHEAERKALRAAFD